MSNSIIDKKEKLLIESTIFNREILLRTYKVLKPEYFSSPLDSVVGFVRDHFDKYSNITNVDVIEAETNVILEERNLDVEDYEFIVDEIEEHCKKQALRLAILNSVDDVDKGDYTAIENRLREAMTVTLNNDIGVNVFEDVAARLHNMKAEKDYRLIGIDAIDRLIGGIARKELGIVGASSGVGKSLLLANIAIKLASQGLKGLIVSIELDTDAYALRTDSMLTGVPIGDILENIDEVAERYEQIKDQIEPFYIKRVNHKFTPNELKVLLNEYKLVNGCYPDFLCLDYIDIMGGGSNNKNEGKFDKDEDNTHFVRDLMNEFDMYGFTASQLNRDADDTVKKLSKKHIAGGISKVNASDWTIGMVQLEEHIDDNVIELQQIKVRNASKSNEYCEVYLDPKTLVIGDVSKKQDKSQTNNSNPLSNKNIKSGKDKLQEALGK